MPSSTPLTKDPGKSIMAKKVHMAFLKMKLWCFLLCLGELFCSVLLVGYRDGEEEEPFWLKPLLFKQMANAACLFVEK